MCCPAWCLVIYLKILPKEAWVSFFQCKLCLRNSKLWKEPFETFQVSIWPLACSSYKHQQFKKKLFWWMNRITTVCGKSSDLFALQSSHAVELNLGSFSAAEPKLSKYNLQGNNCKCCTLWLSIRSIHDYHYTVKLNTSKKVRFCETESFYVNSKDGWGNKKNALQTSYALEQSCSYKMLKMKISIEKTMKKKEVTAENICFIDLVLGKKCS